MVCQFDLCWLCAICGLQKVVLKVNKMCCMKCVEMVTEVISEAEGECGCQSFFLFYKIAPPIFCCNSCVGDCLLNCL
jgi:hypothetical protein